LLSSSLLDDEVACSRERRNKELEKNKVSGIMLSMLFVGMLTLSFDLQIVKAGGIFIFIRPEGSVDPPTVPISSADNVTYTFTDDINGWISVQRSNIVVDGNGYTLRADGTGAGFLLSGVSNVTIKKTNISNFNHGILTWESSKIRVIDNNVTGCQTYGIGVVLSKNVTVDGNTISSTYSAASYGIHLETSTFTTLTGNIVSSNLLGIGMQYSNYTTVKGNIISNNNSTGVYVRDSAGNTMTDNIMKDNRYGIWLCSSYNSLISGNIVANNTEGGIFLQDSNSNTLSANGIVKSSVGIWLKGFEIWYNDIIGNNIACNRGYGIKLAFFYGWNTIYHNNFINNTNQFYFESFEPLQKWDDGYPSGGNYWSNYTCADLFRGAYQNITGSDGIGDTPFIINANNRDGYPLIEPYPWNLHDVGIKGVTSKTVVGQGLSLRISVIVSNHGVFDENFNVSAYVNATEIETKYIALVSSASTTLIFFWNTRGFVKGNYTIGAYATPVSGEICTADNNVTGSWVTVAIIGDITGSTPLVPDGKVDIKDLVAMAIRYGTTPSTTPPGRLPYNPNCDINGDGKIDIKDLATAATNYGKIDP